MYTSRLMRLFVLGVAFVGAPCIARQGAADPPKPAPAAQPSTAPAKPEKPKRDPIYDEAADAKQQIAAALAKAKKENRRVLIQWGGNWCGWCHVLHDTFKGDAKVQKTLLYEYDVVLVDIGRTDKHMDIATGYGADLKANGVPFLTVLDADGKVLANQETGSLEAKTDNAKAGHDPAAVLGFLTKHQAPHLSAESLLNDALARAKAEDKRVLLHFGAPWCPWCHRLEAWAARPDVQPILARDFVDLKIDTDRTVGGKDVLRRFNADGGGGIPWIAVLDPAGKVVVTSNGPDGNIGHPAKDEEIAHFIDMMKKSALRMTDDEMTALRASLVDERKKFGM